MPNKISPDDFEKIPETDFEPIETERQPLKDWQKKLKDIKLPNGAITQVRPYDQGLWLDQARGLSPDKKPGWYDLAGRKLPDEPSKTLMQKAGDLPLSPLAAGVSKLPGMGWVPNPKLANAVQGAKRAWEKLAQLGLSANLAQPLGSGTNAAQAVAAQPNPEAQKYLRDAIKADESAYAQNYEPSLLGEAAGSALAIPIPAGAGARSASLLGRIGSAAVRGGVQGVVAQPSISDTKSFARENAEQFGLGALTGGGLQALGEGGAYLVSKGGQKLAALIDRAKQIEEATGATPTLGDAMTGGLKKPVQLLEKAAEVIPFGGMSETRLRQARAMAGKLASITEQESGSPTDFAASVKRKLTQAKEQYGTPYKMVEEIIDSNGNADLSPLLGALDSARGGITTPNTSKATVAAIDDFSRDIQGIVSGEKPVTFQTLKALRSKLGDKASEFQRAGDNETARVFFGLKREAQNTIDKAALDADPTGLTLKALKQADADWGRRVARFDPNQSEAPAYAVKALKDVRKPDFELDAINNMVNSNSKNLPAFMNEAMDEQGKSAVRKHLLDGFTEAASSGKTAFSPDKFATAIKKKEPWVKALFDKEPADQLMGFANFAKTMERSGQVMENPSTGWGAQQLKMLGAGGAGLAAGQVVGAAKAVALVGGGIGGTQLYLALTATKSGQNLLRKFAMAGDPTSKFAKSLLQNDLPRALSAAQATGHFDWLNKPEFSKQGNEEPTMEGIE